MKELASLNKYFWRYKWHFGLGVLFIILTNYFLIQQPRVIGQAIDLVIEQAKFNKLFDGSSLKPLMNHELLMAVLVCVALNIVLALLRGFFLYCTRQTLIVMSRHIEYDQKNELFGHYQELDTDFYKAHNTGDLMTRITEDVSRVRMYTGPGIMYTLNLLVLCGMVMYQMFHVSPILTLYSMFSLPIMLVAIFIVNSKIESRSEKIQQQLSEITVTAQESYSGIRVIKAFVQETNIIERFKKDCDDYRNRSMSLVKLGSVFFPVIFVLVGLSSIMTIYMGGRLVIEGKITPGIIAEFIIYINMVTWPFATVGWVTALIQRAAVSQGRLNEFFSMKPKLKGGVVEKKLDGAIEFYNVSYTYPNTGIEALKNISFKVNAGERVAIVGRTGSGKSTIGALVTRMVDATAGSVLVDGKEIHTYTFESLRNQIGYVPQDVFLFSDTLANNISFGLDEAKREDIINAARHASFETEAERLPNQFETIIGERGITLSGGQKQRLSIARALVKNTPVLVLDDCLSAVDANTEHIILNNLNKVITGKTTLLITHRIFSLMDFNKIIVLDEGHIAEEGTHEELLLKRGLYNKIYELQRQEDENKSGVLF